MPGWAFRRTAAALVLVVLVLHVAPALRVPMIEDDFRLNRPWTRAEVASVWHGTWFPGHDGDRYYRPLAATWHAVSFEWFGWNQTARLAVSLILVTAIGLLLAALVTAEAGALAGLLVGLAYLTSPLLPEAVSGIVFNQFHEWVSLTVLGAWWVWRRLRHVGAWAWWAPAGMVAVGACFKEDTLAVLPALLVWHGLRAHLVGNLRPLTRRDGAVAGSALLLIVAARALAYPDVEWAHAKFFAGTGPGGLTLDVLRHGIGFMGQSPTHLFTPLAVSVLAVGLNAWALTRAAGPRRAVAPCPGPLAWLVLAGGVLVVATGAPLTIIENTHHTRSHLVALGGAMWLGGALTLLLTVVAANARWQRLAAFGLTAAILTGYTGGLLGAYARLQPCRLEEPEHIVVDLPWLDPAVAAWLRARPSMCAGGPWVPLSTAAPVVVWRRPVMAFAVPPSTVALVQRQTGSAVVSLRAAPVSGVRPATSTARIVLDGGPAHTMEVSDAWQDVTVTFRPTWRSRWRAGQIITITGPGIEVREVRLGPDAR